MRNLFLLWLAFISPAAAGQPAPILLDALRQGGLILFFRHAETGSASPDQAQAVIGQCETQRNLSAEGRAQAVAIGALMRELDIPVGRVLASPFCRTMETASLAFGRADVEQALSLPRHTGDAQALRTMGEALRGLIPDSLPARDNLVLVGHSYHLLAVGGPRLEPQGSIAVLRLMGNGSMMLLGTLSPRDWAKLAERQLALAP